METSTYYKVLLGAQSCHQGAFNWSAHLPQADGDGYIPGEWTPEISEPIICNRGWHLTTDPMRWPKVGMEVYAAEPRKIFDTEGDKIVTDRARLLRAAPETIPGWWHDVERFVRGEIPATPWFKPDGNPDPSWKLFTAPARAAARDAAGAAARDAAGDAARDAAGAAAGAAAWAAARDAAGDAAWAAAWAAARDAAGDAAGDAALQARVMICNGLPLAAKHRTHAAARWNVWQKGYALLCDVAGVLYVYAAGGD